MPVGLGGMYTLPTLEERQCYFPFIDMLYESVFKPENGEKYPEGAQLRFGKAIQVCVLSIHCILQSAHVYIT